MKKFSIGLFSVILAGCGSESTENAIQVTGQLNTNTPIVNEDLIDLAIELEEINHIAFREARSVLLDAENTLVYSDECEIGGMLIVENGVDVEFAECNTYSDTTVLNGSISTSLLSGDLGSYPFQIQLDYEQFDAQVGDFRLNYSGTLKIRESSGASTYSSIKVLSSPELKLSSEGIDLELLSLEYSEKRETSTFDNITELSYYARYNDGVFFVYSDAELRQGQGRIIIEGVNGNYITNLIDGEIDSETSGLDLDKDGSIDAL